MLCTTLQGDSAVAVIAGLRPELHAGIAFVSGSGAPMVLHQGATRTLVGPLSDHRWQIAIPGLIQQEQEAVRDFCEARRRLATGDALPYGLAFSGAAAFDGAARFIQGTTVSGLTCATFVVAAFEWARVPLLDLPTWQERDTARIAEDAAAQKAVMEWLETQPGVTETHHQRAVNEAGCTRFRVEEVAAASQLAPPDRPVGFSAIEAHGARLKAEYYENEASQ